MGLGSYSFQKAKDFTLDRLEDTGNFLIGVLHEQAYTTFSTLYHDFLKRIDKNRAPTSHMPCADDKDELNRECRIENCLSSGFFAGALTDAACAVGTVYYAMGNSSRAAAISAGVIGVKCLGNLGSLIHRDFSRRPERSLATPQTSN